MEPRYPDFALWLPVGALLWIGWYTYRFLDGAGLYSNIMSWQLTIWALHATPIFALRLLDVPQPFELLTCVCWAAFAWRCRSWQKSLFSLSFLVVEALAAVVELDPRVLGVMCSLQAIIATVAWGGILAASCTESVTFVPMDRHLHLGLRHLLRSPGARRCLCHELLSHCIAQALLGVLLWRRLGAPPAARGLLPDLLGAIAAYALCVLAAASALPPHELPYNLGTLPKWLQRPLPLPAWLRGDGASTALPRLPWWMQVPKGVDAKER